FARRCPSCWLQAVLCSTSTGASILNGLLSGSLRRRLANASSTCLEAQASDEQHHRACGDLGGSGVRGQRTNQGSEGVECRLGIVASNHEPLPRLLCCVRHAIDVVLVDDPLLVDKHVPLLKDSLEPCPGVIVEQYGDRRADVLGKKGVDIVDP